jgi:hypothetical protein
MTRPDGIRRTDSSGGNLTGERCPNGVEEPARQMLGDAIRGELAELAADPLAQDQAPSARAYRTADPVRRGRGP